MTVPATTPTTPATPGAATAPAAANTPPAPGAATGAARAPGAGAEALRPHAEDAFADELAALAAADDCPRPARWRLSPWAVATYLQGGVLPDGTVITPKYVGPRRLVEVAVTTLATDRALLLLGVPGTAKTWVSEHLAAAVSGDSTLLVQGTAGTPEEAVRYGWNYAQLLAHGPSRDALVPSPLMRAMSEGMTARVEELTCIPADVQDALITILSEKTLPVPELGQEVQAVRGFNLIATANDRDRGVNELSSALRRRFNTVVLPLPATAQDEVDIVSRRVDQIRPVARPPGRPGGAGRDPPRGDGLPRTARGDDHRRAHQAQVPLGHALHRRGDLGRHQRPGARRPLRRRRAAPRRRRGRHPRRVVRHRGHRVAWQEYLETVVRERDGWKHFYRACREVSA
ncbi:AAA family ATPase [Streptomyces californicus]